MIGVVPIGIPITQIGTVIGELRKRRECPIKLLLAEDENRMLLALQELLIQEGYEVQAVADGEAALLHLESGKYDVAVLDVMMPKLNGYEVAARVRSDGIGTAILMLTARGDLEDKVKGLDSGADDYVTKPFMTEELLARLRALVRRQAGKQEEKFSFGDIELRPVSAELCCVKTGQSVRLSEKEYRILEYMISNRGQILSREQLAVRIWGYESQAEYNNVEVYMSFTRKKLTFVGAATEIKAVRGMGYELRCPDVS